MTCKTEDNIQGDRLTSQSQSFQLHLVPLTLHRAPWLLAPFMVIWISVWRLDTEISVWFALYRISTQVCCKVTAWECLSHRGPRAEDYHPHLHSPSRALGLGTCWTTQWNHQVRTSPKGSTGSLLEVIWAGGVLDSPPFGMSFGKSTFQVNRLTEWTLLTKTLTFLLIEVQRRESIPPR